MDYINSFGESVDDVAMKQQAVEIIKNTLKTNNITYNLTDDVINNWYNNVPSPLGGYDLAFYVNHFTEAYRLLNDALSGLGFYVSMDNYGIIRIKSGLSIQEEELDELKDYITEEANYSEENQYPVFIVLQHSGTALATVIKKMTGNEFSHACISFNPYLDPLYSFGNKKSTTLKADPGFVIQHGRHSDFYNNYTVRYAVYVMYVNEEAHKAMKATLREFIKRKHELKYDFVSLIYAWLGKETEKSEKYFCSKFVAKVLTAGYDLGKVPSLWKPEDFKKLNNITLVNRGDNFKKYSSKKTIENLELVKQHKFKDIKLETVLKPIYDPLGNTLKTTDDIEFELPDLNNYRPDIKTLLDNTPEDRIFLTSDWHFFKNHYKREINYVNTKLILAWCRNNIKEDDVFIYLGDLSFRYANTEDQKRTQDFMASIPGHKIFVLGNHDKMLGAEYFQGCGFDYVVEEFAWRNYIFTHRPVNMSTYPPDWINIHGHIHNIRKYNTTDGKRNINVYPLFYDNKPTTFKYVSTHVEKLTKDNEWNWNAGYGEAAHEDKNLLSYIQEQNNVVQLPKPTVYYSSYVDSKIIAYMVSLFKDRLGSRTAIKLHFGEDGNRNFLNPRLLKDLVQGTNGALVDSNTAYKGSTRGDTVGHIETAKKHGFDFAYIDILDADGEITLGVPKRFQVQRDLDDVAFNRKQAYEVMPTMGEHLQEIRVGSHIKNYDSMIVYTHFKGHSIAGYGGALKNIGMGIPSKNGKLDIHGKNFEVNGHLFLERLVESGSAIQSIFDGKIIYVNILQNMSTECDCERNAARPTIPDIGVLVSDDIVAIEQASLDFIRNAPKNKDLMERISNKAGTHQIEYMEYLNMGRRNYILRDIRDGERLILESQEGFKRFFHVSKTPDIKVLKPAIPESWMVLQGYEDNLTPRVSFAPSIDKCLMALSQNLTGQEFYVYEAIDTRSIQPASVSKVPDSKVTKEHWSVTPVEVKMIGKIRVISDDGKPGRVYTYGQNKRAKLYGWNYEFIENVNENMLLNKKDIKHNYKAFKYGDCNLALVVGFSGSGKSTMGRYLAKSVNNAEHYELDDVMVQWNFSDEQLKEYGDLVYSFFTGPGKRFRITYDALVELNIDEDHYEKPLTKEFLEYAENYARTHRNKKYVIEGVWPLMYKHDPRKYKDWCVIVKGTSYLTSEVRASKREGKSSNLGLGGMIKDFLQAQRPSRLKRVALPMNQSVEVWRKYYQNLQDKESVKESYYETENDIYWNNYLVNETAINKFNKILINKENIDKYKSSCSALKHIKDDAKGFLFIDNKDSVAALIAVNEKDGEKWITALEVFDPYKGLNLSYDLLNIATNDLGATKLSVRKNNNIAKHVYDKYGFKTYNSDDYMEYMTLSKNIQDKETNKPIEESVQYKLSDKEINDIISIKKSLSSEDKKNLNMNNDSDYDTTGDICFIEYDGKTPVAYFIIDTEKDSNADVSFAVRSEYQSKGYGTKIVNKAINYIKSHLNDFNTIYWATKPNNTASQKLAEKAGFKVVRDDSKWKTYALYGTKNNNTIHETKRSNLPDSAFGIPEDRKFPLDTAQHVKSAIHLFGHAEESKKKSLAHRINSAAKKYGINIPETTQCYKYLNEGAFLNIIPAGRNTLIFDMGYVLCDIDIYKALMQNKDIPNEYVVEIEDIIVEYFSHKEPYHVLRNYDTNQAKAYFVELAPEHIKPYVDSVFDSFLPAIYKYDYVDSMLEYLRNHKFNLYYLSNWDRYLYDAQKPFFDELTSKFDGGLFSCHCNYEKPSKEIYEELITEYGLNPQDCVFFDDMQENVDSAIELGIHGVLFDSNSTPKMIMGSGFELPANANDKLLLRVDNGIETVDIHSIKWWYISDSKNPPNVDEEMYYPSLDECVKHKVGDLIRNGSFTDEYPMVEQYVFINSNELNGESVPNLCIVGQIAVYQSGAYEWIIQFPIELVDNTYKPIKEYAANAVNPVTGICKPYVLMAMQNNGIKGHILSPDIENDKYLSIDLDGKFEVIKKEDISHVEAVYEFVGNPAYVDRLISRYKDPEYVSEGIYTELTDKPMLTLDQIDFDKSFRKIDIDLMEQKAIAEIVTLKRDIRQLMDRTVYDHPILESYVTRIPKFVSKYNKMGDIMVMEDFDGAYFYSTLTKKRSGSVATAALLTENMLKAIL